jgi:hypothetical protein
MGGLPWVGRFLLLAYPCFACSSLHLVPLQPNGAGWSWTSRSWPTAPACWLASSPETRRLKPIPDLACSGPGLLLVLLLLGQPPGSGFLLPARVVLLPTIAAGARLKVASELPVLLLHVPCGQFTSSSSAKRSNHAAAVCAAASHAAHSRVVTRAAEMCSQTAMRGHSLRAADMA